MPHRTPCHTVPYYIPHYTHILYQHHPRGSTIRGLNKYRYHHTAVPTNTTRRCTRAYAFRATEQERSIDTILLFQHHKYTETCERATSDGSVSVKCTRACAFRATEQERVYISYCCSNAIRTQEHASARRAIEERQLSDRNLLYEHHKYTGVFLQGNIVGGASTRLAMAERRQLSERRGMRGHKKSMYRAEHSSTKYQLQDENKVYRFNVAILRVVQTSSVYSSVDYFSIRLDFAILCGADIFCLFACQLLCNCLLGAL